MPGSGSVLPAVHTRLLQRKAHRAANKRGQAIRQAHIGLQGALDSTQQQARVHDR